MRPSIPRTQESDSRNGAHPGLEALIAYQGGALPEVEERRLCNHLVGCNHCAQLLLDLADFSPKEPEDNSFQDSAATEFSKAATWRLLRQRTPFLQPQLNRRWLPAAVGPAVAASLLVGILGISGWALINNQQGQLEELHDIITSLSQPQANAPIFDLRPGGSLRSRRNNVQQLPIPEGSGFTLILNLIESYPSAIYQARFLNVSRSLITTVNGLTPDELGTLTLLVPAGWLAEGEYTVELRRAGMIGSGPPLESYSIETIRP